MELILPCLYSETEGKALPKILDEINKTNYINHIIIGLDQVVKSRLKLLGIFSKSLKHLFLFCGMMVLT